MGVKPITWEIRGRGAGGDRAAGAGDTYSQTPLVRVFFGKWQGTQFRGVVAEGSRGGSSHWTVGTPVAPFPHPGSRGGYLLRKALPKALSLRKGRRG